MSQIISISIDRSKLEALPTFTSKYGKEYYNLTVFVNDEPDKFGNDASVTLQQSAEDRKAKTPKTYVGNGKVLYGKQ